MLHNHRWMSKATTKDGETVRVCSGCGRVEMVTIREVKRIHDSWSNVREHLKKHGWLLLPNLEAEVKVR